MANYVKQYITLEEFNTLQKHGLQYTGFIKGVGYTYSSTFALAPAHMQIQRMSPFVKPGLDKYILGKAQYLDTSPEAIARSYNVKSEDIAKKIVTTNPQQGTITVNMGNQNYVTLPIDNSNIKIDVIDDRVEQTVTVLAHNTLTNELTEVKTKMTDVPVVFGSGFNIFGDRIGKVGEDASSQGDEVGYVMAKKITSAYQFYTDPYAYECATKGKGMLTVKEKQKVDDDTFEAMTYLIPYGTIFKGAKLTFMGLSTVSKASVGLKVLGEASKGTLRSSLYFTGLLNKHGLNYTVRNWPVLIGPRAKTLGTFLGRNSALIGGGTMGAGGLGVYGLNWLYSDDD